MAKSIKNKKSISYKLRMAQQGKMKSPKEKELIPEPTMTYEELSERHVAIEENSIENEELPDDEEYQCERFICRPEFINPKIQKKIMNIVSGFPLSTWPTNNYRRVS